MNAGYSLCGIMCPVVAFKIIFIYSSALCVFWTSVKQKGRKKCIQMKDGLIFKLIDAHLKSLKTDSKWQFLL